VGPNGRDIAASGNNKTTMGQIHCHSLTEKTLAQVQCLFLLGNGLWNDGQFGISQEAGVPNPKQNEQ